MTPVFPYCHTALAERGIVWDVFSLIESIKRPGAHQLLTCECGYASDADIEEAVLVSHPDEHTVDPDAAWPREPLWPSGTLLEFGFFKNKYGHDWLMIDGQVKRACWPGHYFSRWQALEAFNAWVATTERGHSLPTGSCTPEEDVNHQNTRFLRQESDRDVCHAAGRHLAQVLQHGYQEGSTAPGVMVRYRACPLNVI